MKIKVTNETNKMANTGCNPEDFVGKSWTVWAQSNDLKLKTSENSDSPTPDKLDTTEESVKISHHDQSLYGLCPARDEFFLVVCEECRQVVKPQALQKHISQRHSNQPSDRVVDKTLLSDSCFIDAHLSTITEDPLSLISTKLINSSLFCLPNHHRSSPVGRKKKKSLGVHHRTESSLLNSKQKRPINCEHTNNNKKCKIDALATNGVEQVGGHTVVTTASVSVDGAARSGIVRQLREPLLMSFKSSPNLTTVTIPTSSSSSLPHSDVKEQLRPDKLLLNILTSSAMTTDTSVVVTTCSASNATLKKTPTTPRSKKLRLSSSLKDMGWNIPCKDREYDPDRHCGVIDKNDAKICTHSLTCKTHSLSLRRAVSGRSKPFDQLLCEHRAQKEEYMRERQEKLDEMKMRSKSKSNKSAETTTTSIVITPTITQPLFMTPSAAGLKDSGLLKSTNDDNSVIMTTAADYSNYPISVQPFTRPSKTAIFRNESRIPLPSDVTDVDGEAEVVNKSTKRSFTAQHSRPVAVNSFGAWSHGCGCYVFNRKEDLYRAAFMAALERHLHPPPHKKLCVTSKLADDSRSSSSESKDPYDFVLPETSFRVPLTSPTSNKSQSKSKRPSPTILPSRTSTTSVESVSRRLYLDNPPGLASVTLEPLSSPTSSVLSLQRTGDVRVVAMNSSLSHQQQSELSKHVMLITSEQVQSNPGSLPVLDEVRSHNTANDYKTKNCKLLAKAETNRSPEKPVKNFVVAVTTTYRTMPEIKEISHRVMSSTLANGLLTSSLHNSSSLVHHTGNVSPVVVKSSHCRSPTKKQLTSSSLSSTTVPVARTVTRTSVTSQLSVSKRNPAHDESQPSRHDIRQSMVTVAPHL